MRNMRKKNLEMQIGSECFGILTSMRRIRRE